MSYFKPLEPEGQVVVLVDNGIYRQCPLYTFRGHLFARLGSGFVRLAADGSTSKARVRIESMVCDLELHRDQFGRLCDASVSGAKVLDNQNSTKLLGVST